MDKIKDFFYEKSDLFFASVVVMIVGFVVFNNLGGWMNADAEDSKYSAIQSRIESEERPDSISEDENAPIDSEPGQDAQEEPAGSKADSEDANQPADKEETPASQPAGNPGSSADKPSGAAKSRNISVAPGSTAQSIADSLKSQGLISDTGEFLKSLASSGKDTKLKAGDFSFPEGASNDQIIDILTK